MANISAPTVAWENRGRPLIGAAIALAYLVEIEEGVYGETNDLSEATHIEVLLPDGMVGIDEIGHYSAQHTEEIEIGGEVIAITIGAYRDPLFTITPTFSRASTAGYSAEVAGPELGAVTFSRASAASYVAEV